MRSLISFTKMFNNVRRNRCDYAEMIKHSESFIRVYNPDAHKAHYFKGVSNLLGAPAYDEVFNVAMNLGVNNLVGSHEGHLFLNGDPYQSPPTFNIDSTFVEGIKFVHFIKFLVDGRVKDITHLKNFEICSQYHLCLNPDHAGYNLKSDPEIQAIQQRREEEESAKLEKQQRIEISKEDSRKKFEANRIIVNGELNLERWKKIHARDTTQEQRNLSRNLCPSRKVSFCTEQQVREMKNLVNKSQGKPKSKGGVYDCGQCDYWHITSHVFTKASNREWVKRVGMVY